MLRDDQIFRCEVILPASGGGIRSLKDVREHRCGPEAHQENHTVPMFPSSTGPNFKDMADQGRGAVAIGPRNGHNRARARHFAIERHVSPMISMKRLSLHNCPVRLRWVSGTPGLKTRLSRGEFNVCRSRNGRFASFAASHFRVIRRKLRPASRRLAQARPERAGRRAHAFCS
jgi:hypothetical protein